MQKNRLAWVVAAFAAVSLLLVLAAQQALPPSGQFSANPPMVAARQGAASAALSDGRILVTGGQDSTGPLASAEFLSGAAAGTMVTPRYAHIAVALQDGTVLVAGGRTTGDAVTNAAELYAGGVWTPISAMLVARAGATATLLQDGRVLIAGGQGSGGALQTTEIFDPASGQFNNGPPMSTVRQNHAAALLLDGRVILAGGSDGSNALAGIDLFDPQAGAIAPFATMSAARDGLSATTLMSGKVLLAGGTVSGNASASTEILDAAAASTAAGPSMSTARSGHMALLLPNNNTVLMAGGTTASAAAEIFVEWQNAFAPFGSLSSARTAVTGGASSQSASAAVAGGVDSTGAVSTAVDAVRFPMVATDKPDYQPGDTATITGSGFAPNEIVNVIINEVVDIDHDSPITLTPPPVADASGSFSVQFPIDVADLNVHFYLNATGQTSGLTAGMTFTDGSVTVKASSGSTFTLIQDSFNNSTCSGTPQTTTTTTLVNSTTGVTFGVGTNHSARLTAASTSDQGGAFINWTSVTAFTGTNPICVGSTTTTYTANYAAAGSIKIVKNTTGGDGTFGFTITGPSASTPSVTTASGTGNTGLINVTPGSYSVSETVPANWSLTSSSCSSGTPASFTVTAGATVTCTFNDTAQGKIQIVKNTTAGSGDTTFNFSVSGPNSFSNSPSVTTTGNSASTPGTGQLATPLTVNVGSGYSVSETVPANWRLASSSCSSGTPGSFSVTLGATVTCTFNDTGQGKIQVAKVTTAGSGDTTFNFSVSGPNSYSNSPSVTTTGNTASVNGTGQLGTPLTVDVGGGYSVSETVPANWRLASSSCSSGTPGSFAVSTGATVTCTFTDTAQGKIQIVKNTTAGSGDTTFNFSVSGPNSYSNSPAITTTGNTASVNGTGQLATPLTVDVGSGYSVSETVPANWRLASSSCSVGTPGSFSVTLGATVTCTFNDTGQGKIQVAKVTTAGSGDTTFNFSVSGPNSYSNSPAVTTTGNTASVNGTGQLGTPLTVDVGSGYSVSETVPANWRLASSSCSVGTPGSFTVSTGGTVTCTFTDTGQGKIQIVKNTTAGSGDTTFNFSVSGPNSFSNSPSVTTTGNTASLNGTGQLGTPLTVDAGSAYSVSETVPANWRLASSSCSAGTPASFAVSTGGTVTCTFTDVGQGKIQIVKNTTAGSGDTTFNFSVSGPNSYSNSPAVTTTGNTASVNGTGQLGTPLTVDVGSAYSVSETVPANWRLASSSCSVGTPANFAVSTGGTVTCTFTDTGQGKIQIVKNTTAGSGDTTFNFSVSGPNSYSNSPGITTAGNTAVANGTGQLGTPLTVDVGSGYSVSETVPANWRLASSSCSVGTPSSFAVSTGVTVTCTFTDTGQGKIQIVKNTAAGSGDTTFNFSVSGPNSYSNSPGITTAGNTAITNGTGQLGTPLTVDAGSAYSVSETVPANWRLANSSCSAGTPASFAVSTGGTVTCTFTDVGQGKIQIVKNTTAGSGDTTFNFSVSGPNSYSNSPSVTTAGNTAVANGTGQLGTPLTVDAGSAYSVSETVPANWRLASSSCSVGAPGSFAVSTGATVTCTFTDTAQGKIQIVKNTTAGSGDTTFNFSVSGPNSYSNSPGITTAGNTAVANGTGQLGTPLTVDVGSGYSVSETVPADWRLASSSCSSGTPAGFNVTLGVTVTCTFTDTGQGKIQIVKNTAAGSGDTTFNFSVSGPNSYSNSPSVTTSGNTASLNGTGQLGTPLTVDVGSAYSVSETVPANWRLANSSCSAGTPASFAVSTGVTVTCTFTDVGQGKIQIAKVTTAGSGDTTFNFSVSGPNSYSNSPGITTAGNTASVNGTGQLGTPLTVDAGSAYSVSETVPANWRLANSSCSVGTPSSFAVSTGGTVTCTFTDVGQGTINITKNTLGGNGTFGFAVTGPTSSTPSVMTSGGTATKPITVDVGSYSVAETSVPAPTWILTSSSCSSGTPGSFGVSTGGSVTCTFNNTNRPTLTVTKRLIPGADPGVFNLLIGGTPYAMNVGDGGSTGAVILNAGPYTIGESQGTNTSLANYFELIGGDCATSGTITLVNGQNASCTITNVLATVTVKTTATNSTTTQPQYSDPVTFKAVVSADTTVISPALAGSVTFYLGTPGPAGETSMGSCNLATDNSGNLTCSVMAPLVDPGTPPQRPPTGNFAPGAHTVYAVFGGVSPAVNAAAKPTTPLTINQEDAQATYTGLEYFGAPAGATTMDVTVSYSLQDATATGAINPIYDAYAGDITNAKVTLTLTQMSGPFTGSCSPLPVLAVAGAVDPTNMAPSTGTVSCVIHNVPVPGAFNLAATPAAGSYYTFLGETSMPITTNNNGTGFITGGGHQTAAYLATPGAAGSGKYTTAGLLKPAPGTKMNFGFETKYNKSGSNLQGGANIIVRSSCVAGIAGYTPVPGDDGLCVYQIKTNGNGNITSLTENLTAPKSPNYAAFTARNVTITDVTRPIALLVAGNANLQLTMYDVGEPGANTDTLAIQVTDSVNGLWISNNWSGTSTPISTTAPVINGGNLAVH